MDKKTAYIVSSIILISAVIIFAWPDTRDEVVVPPIVQTSTSTPQTLKSYQNIEHSIGFVYPSTYTLTQKELGNAERKHLRITLVSDTTVRENSEGPTSINFDIYQNNLDKQTIASWVKNYSESNFKQSVVEGKYASTTVAGKEAITYTWDGLYQGDSYVFAHATNIIMASVTYLTPEDTIKKDFETILSNLKL
ncbi:MAG: hypothetical protein V4519_03510 [Patescibacteria group bacterium]